MKASNLILAVIAALMIVGCGGHAGNGAERTRQQDSLLRRVDDSVRLQSPYAPLLIRQGLAAANDSVTYYEYYRPIRYSPWMTFTLATQISCSNDT